MFFFMLVDRVIETMLYNIITYVNALTKFIRLGFFLWNRLFRGMGSNAIRSKFSSFWCICVRVFNGIIRLNNFANYLYCPLKFLEIFFFLLSCLIAQLSTSIKTTNGNETRTNKKWFRWNFIQVQRIYTFEINRSLENITKIQLTWQYFVFFKFSRHLDIMRIKTLNLVTKTGLRWSERKSKRKENWEKER